VLFRSMLLAVVNRETPYRVIAKPLESRIHLGKEEEPATAPAVQTSQPAPAATAAPAVDAGP